MIVVRYHKLIFLSLPETCLATVEELNKLKVNEMIDGRGWQNNFPFSCRAADEGMANVICRSISAVRKSTVQSQLELYKK